MNQPHQIHSGHLESFRPVALPGDTWNTELWLSSLSRGIGAEHVTSPRLPMKSEYQGHFNQELWRAWKSFEELRTDMLRLCGYADMLKILNDPCHKVQGSKQSSRNCHWKCDTHKTWNMLFVESLCRSVDVLLRCSIARVWTFSDVSPWLLISAGLYPWIHRVHSHQKSATEAVKALSDALS